MYIRTKIVKLYKQSTCNNIMILICIYINKNVFIQNFELYSQKKINFK